MSFWHEGMTVTEKWNKIGLLQGLTESKKEPMAHALDSQRLFNEKILDVLNIAAFKRISIPIVRRALVDVNFEVTETKTEHVTPVTILLWDGSPGRVNHSLDKEADDCAIASHELTEYLKKFTTVKFHAFSLKDNKVVFHGELA